MNSLRLAILTMSLLALGIGGFLGGAVVYADCWTSVIDWNQFCGYGWDTCPAPCSVPQSVGEVSVAGTLHPMSVRSRNGGGRG